MNVALAVLLGLLTIPAVWVLARLTRNAGCEGLLAAATAYLLTCIGLGIGVNELIPGIPANGQGLIVLALLLVAPAAMGLTRWLRNRGGRRPQGGSGE